MRKSAFISTLGCAWIALACSQESDSGATTDLAARGKHYYQNVCIACHSADPSQDGTLGPAVAGSSQALLDAKVLHGKYPPGYAPKRSTQAMPSFAFLAQEIPALAAYLDNPKP